MSPHLFNIYSEQIMREADIEEMGRPINVGGRDVTNLRYADDTALLADNLTTPQHFLSHTIRPAGFLRVKLYKYFLKITFCYIPFSILCHMLFSCFSCL